MAVINCAHLQTIIYLRESRLKGAKLTGNSPCLSRRLCFPPAGGGGLGRRRSPAHRRRAPVPVPPAASALFIARGQRGGFGRRGAAGDRLGQRPPTAGRGQGGRCGSARHRRPAPCSAPGASCASAARPGRSPTGAARAPGAPSGRRWRGSRKQVGAGALAPARPFRPSVRPAGCRRHRRPLLRRSYTGPGLGEAAASSQSEMPFPVCSLPPPSLSPGRPGPPRAPARCPGPRSSRDPRGSPCMTSSTARSVLSFLNCLFSRKRDKSRLTEGGGGINIIPV